MQLKQSNYYGWRGFTGLRYDVRTLMKVGNVDVVVMQVGTVETLGARSRVAPLAFCATPNQATHLSAPASSQPHNGPRHSRGTAKNRGRIAVPNCPGTIFFANSTP